jgi:TolB-like protein
VPEYYRIAWPDGIGILTLVGIFLFGCITLDTNEKSVFLDDGIRQTSENIVENLSENTKLTFLYFSSPSENFSEYIIEELLTNLVNAKKFTIVDRKYLDQVRNELNLQASGDVSDESAQSIGKFIGAESIITGTLQQIGNTHRLRFNIITVETAERQAAFSFDLISKDKQAYSLLNNKDIIMSPQVALRQQKKSYFDGNGGSGIFLGLYDLETKNISDDDLWLKFFIQGSIENIIMSYSNVGLLVRGFAQEMLLVEMESGYYSEDEIDFSMWQMANNNLTGTITKISTNEFSINMVITNVTSRMQSAAYTGIFTMADIRNGIATRKMCYEILKQMGIIFTETGEKAILEVK